MTRQVFAVSGPARWAGTMTQDNHTDPTIALVTGGNKGIGREIAGQLAALGMTVLLGARDPGRGAQTAAELRATGADVQPITLDVTDELASQLEAGATVALRDPEGVMLAALTVTQWWRPDLAAEAEAAFDRVFIAREMPTDIAEATISADGGVVHLPAVIAEVFGGSRSEARRSLSQGGVKLDGSPLPAEPLDVPAASLDGRVLQLGKRHFRRLRVA